MSWTLDTRLRIVYGRGIVAELPRHVPGKRVVLITTPGFMRRGLPTRLEALFEGRLIKICDQTQANPDIAELEALAASLRLEHPDAVIGLGGGSAIDTAKALAASLNAPANWTLSRHFTGEVPLGDWPPVALTAVPTTAGTGSEVTPFATVWDKAGKRKHSLAGSMLLPSLALLDPELTLDLPEDITVATGLDAISQALEALWNRNANPVTDAWALRSLHMSLPTLPKLSFSLNDILLRDRMLKASLLAGLAISHTRTALAHSMSYPMTAHFGLPHGLACGFTLPAILNFNAEHAQDRMNAVSQDLGFADAHSLEQALRNVLTDIDIRSRVLRHIGKYDRLFPLSETMLDTERAHNNLHPVSQGDIKSILSKTRNEFFS